MQIRYTSITTIRLKNVNNPNQISEITFMFMSDVSTLLSVDADACTRFVDYMTERWKVKNCIIMPFVVSCFAILLGSWLAFIKLRVVRLVLIQMLKRICLELQKGAQEVGPCIRMFVYHFLKC